MMGASDAIQMTKEDALKCLEAGTHLDGTNLTLLMKEVCLKSLASRENQI